jgi:CheY-like chemotaxis protein
MNTEKQTVLVVDDATENIDVIVSLLKEQYRVKAAVNGLKALKVVDKNPPDLILLDIMMPEMDGYEVIQRLKDNPKTENIPVIFLTGKTEAADETKGFEMGAVDYISKPFSPSVVKARVNTHLELVKQRKKVEQLLSSILPAKVITELKNGGKVKPELFDNVSVLFSDFVNFTDLSAAITPELLISELSELFTKFDDIMLKNGCERIKTIGDAYMAVCGMPHKDANHAENLVRAATEMIAYLKDRNATSELQWEARIGVHSGPVVGGIVGTTKYIYDIFGDTVNTASRIETSSESMRISISDSTFKVVGNSFPCTSRGAVELKGKGDIELYFVEA